MKNKLLLLILLGGISQNLWAYERVVCGSTDEEVAKKVESIKTNLSLDPKTTPHTLKELQISATPFTGPNKGPSPLICVIATVRHQ